MIGQVLRCLRYGVLLFAVSMTTMTSANAKVIHKNVPIPNQYIVNFGTHIPPGDVPTAAARLASNHGVKLLGTWNDLVSAFAFDGPEIAAMALSALPEVDFVEENGTYETASLLWNIDRIDQPTLPLDGFYRSCCTCTRGNVVVYVVDTGVRASHAEFADSLGSRVVAGQNFLNDNQSALDHA